MPEPTPERRTAGDEKGWSIHTGEPQPSKHQHRVIARHANADSARLPPAAAREARNLQNFFPFPRQEEEEALEDDNIEEEERNGKPADDPVGFLDCCCWWGVEEKWSFFSRETSLSLENALLMASSCSTFDDFSTAF